MDGFLSAINGTTNFLSLKINEAKIYIDNQNFEKAGQSLKEVLEIEPDSPEANFILAQIYEFDEQFEKSAECYEKVYKQNPNDDIKIRLAQAYESAESYSKALNLFSELYDANPKDKDYCEKIAHLSVILGYKSKAAEFYNKLLKNDSDNIIALTQLQDLYHETNPLMYHLTKARIHEMENALSYAVNAYKKALSEAETTEDIIQIRFKLAEIFIKKEQPMHAVDEFLVILENDPENFKVYKELADIYISVENSEAAVETYEKALEIYPDHTETMKELAELYIELQNYDKAESLLEKALSYEADDIAGLISIARVKVFLGKNDEAIEKINRIFEKEPDNIEALGILADYYTSSGQYEKALLQTEKIRKKLPNSSFGYRKTSEICEKAGMIYEMHYYYGIFHNLKGEKQLAIDEFSHALDLNPNNTDIMLKIAELYEELTEPYIAIEYYERIFNIDNSSISSLKKAGELYFRQKNYEKASACFEIVLESDKSDKELYFKLAQAQENYKDREKAFENYKKFIKLAPLSPKTDEAKSKIEKLESKLYGEDDEGFLEKIFKFFTK